jgi:hypothetical protein
MCFFSVRSEIMSDNNRISATLPDPAMKAVMEAIQTIRTNLPFLISLTNDERRTLPKLGDNRLALDEDAYTLMQNHPDFVPGYLDQEELAKDRALRSQVDRIRVALEALHNDIEGTEMLIGSEMLMAYLAFYSNAQQAAKRGAAGGQAVVNTLGKYFARSPKAAPAASQS